MDLKGKSSGILAIAALLIATGACATAQQAPPPPPPPPSSPPPPTPVRDDCTGVTNHNIEIGSRVSCKWVFLHANDKGNGNTVNWRATDPNMNVQIQFEDTTVFKTLSCPGTQNVCQSGPLNPAIPGDPSKDYRYHVHLCDKAGNCGQEIDPGIIIVP